ncbi:hypothetical protein AMTRI_Chr05g63870 [Amborella trichopoda]
MWMAHEQTKPSLFCSHLSLLLLLPTPSLAHESLCKPNAPEISLSLSLICCPLVLTQNYFLSSSTSTLLSSSAPLSISPENYLLSISLSNKI